MNAHAGRFRRPLPAAAIRGVLAAFALSFTLSTALADALFEAPDADYHGQIRASGATGNAVLPGGEVKLSGRNFKPGQEITLSDGLSVLNPSGAFVADDKGGFEGTFKLPAEAAVGTHPLVVTAEKPSYAAIFELKVSPDVALSGADKFDSTSSKLVQGLYQSAYSAKNDVLFVTAAVGRPPVKQSAILKVDPQTLAIISQAAPAPDGEGVFAVYGVAVDDANDTVWVTNTRHNTVAVYKQSDLSLVKQFDKGLVPHARDVAVDAKTGKVYASANGAPTIAVFDGKTAEFVKNIEIASGVRGEDFAPASLAVDPVAGKVFTVGLSTSEAAVIDTATDTVEKVFPIEGAKNAIGVSYDAETKRLLVAGQATDNLLIVDAESGKTLHSVPVGAGTLNVAFDPVSKLAYVTSRDAGTLTVVNRDGQIVANLANAPLPNHVIADGKGDIFAVNKSRNPDDAEGDNITRFKPKG